MSEPVVDPAEFERVKAEVTYLHGIIDAQATTINTLKDSVLQLSTSMTVLQRQLSGATAGPRIALPDKWNGVDGRPDGLLATLDMIFECYSSHYETSRSKVALLTSLLSGRAQEWAAALYNAKSPICNDYFLFSEELRKTFVPASGERAPDSQLLHLRQGSFSVCHYASEFRTLSAKLSWGDDALRALFIEGLADHIRDEMTGKEASQTLDAAVDLALRIDQRILTRPPPAQRWSRPPSTHMPSPPRFSFPGAAASPAAEEPMQLGRLPQGERDRRWREGLCAYCGSSEHRRPQCPLRPGNGTAR
uniref:Retrotransposon gag domain-containing protein n=1 Tax=Denticeps clupeoides TaxID=299321 RepID=A0AAY4B9U5_9TELE